MKFVLIFGPQAVGKMTAGQELERLTGLKLFHNHMTPFFSYSTPSGKNLVKTIRRSVFEEVAGSDLKGLIFTYVWNFDSPSDWAFVQEVCEIFERKGAETYFVELESPVDVRLERNRTENRLLHKPTKRDFAFSERDLLKSHENKRLNSQTGEIRKENYMRIHNSELSAKEVAERIKGAFQL